MHAAESGDFGPLVFAAICLVVSLLLLLNVRGVARTMAQRVVDRSAIHAKLGVTFGFRTLRAAGLVGIVMAVAIALFA